MVQTFGKRVLGGIGAPGGDMSTAYGEGVNTAINQRAARQGMAETAQAMQMRDQEMAWAAQDREEAKRQRAAAAAAAAAARARSAALAQALAGGVGASPAPGLKIPPGKTYGPRVAVGGPIPATPPAARPALPQVTPGAPLSFKLGAAGQQVSEAPMNISNIEFVQGTTEGGATRANLAARPGNFQAQATQRAMAAGIPDPRAYNPDLEAMVMRAQADVVAAELAFKDMPTGFTSDQVAAAKAQLRELEGQLPASQAALGYAQRPLVTTRGVTAEEGPGSVTLQGPIPQARQQTPTSTTGVTGPTAMQGPPVAPTVTIQGPNGPIVLPIEEAYPTGNVYGAEPTPAQLSFGPALGAVGADQNATAADRVAANPVGQAQPTPNTELYIMEPGRPGRELQQTYDAREELVRQLNIYAEYGDYAAVRDLTTKINEMDNSLYLLQGMQGIQELQFNSPQRLQMVLSEQFGRDIGLQPNAQGGYDIYVDGMLALQKDAGNGENSVSYWARTVLDSAFAEAEASRAAEYGKLAYESGLQREEIMAQGDVNAQLAQQKAALERESARIAGLTELDMMAIKRDLGLTNDDKLQFEKDETSGFILVFRNGEFEAQYGPAEDTSGNVVGFEQKY
jgi:hypothetical protein